MDEEKKAPFDALILVLVLSLSGLGLVMLLSASSIMAEQRFGDAYYFFRPQLRNLILGLVLMLIISRVPYQFWLRLAYPALAVSLIGLALVLVPGVGHQVGGAHRWLRLPGLTFQPSETAKLAIVIYLAYSLSRKGSRNASFIYGLLPHLSILGLTVGLILAEPDLGTAFSVAMIAFIMMGVAGIKIWHLAALSLAGGAVLYYEITSYAYRLRRIAAFLDPWSDPQGAGYHIIHSFYAFASGGLWGQGPGASQQKLFFLPEPHTDFIFSVLAEEVGLAGVFVIGTLFLVLAFRGLSIARAAAARDYSGVYLALGATLVVAVPAFLNMAVVTALIPTKGLPLPFFSYGGTNLLVCCAALGMLMNVSSQCQGELPERTPRAFKAARVLA
ncbi:MAG: putative lipid II flippase FtsW [Candidatus Adiutrix sp.]|jgi:cell division protein FtsW|nr:putative lipid II flippase FtsW [Candidatus Adiutrix sp.]